MNILTTSKSENYTNREDREILEEILSTLHSSPYANEHLTSKIQKSFPNLSQNDLRQMLNFFIEWMVDGIVEGNPPARIIPNPDGSISIKILNIGNENDGQIKKMLP